MDLGLSVSEAVCQRGSVRAFSDEAVDKELVEEILKLAGYSPSGSNLQPWKVYALTGKVKDALVQAVLAKAAQQPAGDTPDIAMYPPGLGEPWRQRRADCGAVLYERLGIARDDKAARYQQAAKNLTFFGAPVGLIVTMDRSLSDSQMIDIGIFIQTVMLLAQERGLATCPQASWQMWSETIRSHLHIDDKEMVMVGIALGLADKEEPAAHVPQPRLPVDQYTTLLGFPD